MDEPRDCHTEGRKSNREGEISYNIPYMWNLKRNDTDELTKQRDSQTYEDELMVARGRDGGKGQLESWGWTCTHCCI